ncbi:MAG: hypothetical protein Q8P83_01720 [bacterium]|nr:hypothetical protein [bacterium]
MDENIFIIDNCIRLHADQFAFYCPYFTQSFKFAMNQTGAVAKSLDGEYNGLYIITLTGGKESIHGQGPFSTATSQHADHFQTLRPENITGIEKCISATGEINFDKLLVLTAGVEMTRNIVSDDPYDIRKYSNSFTYDTSISSFWDLLIATIHHSDLSLRWCLSTADTLKKMGSFQFPTKFWGEDRYIKDSCVFCDHDITKYVREFKRKS